MVSKKKKETKAEPVIYVGSTLPNGILFRYTVFCGNFPPHIVELMDKSPALRGLMVPISKLQQAKKDVETQGHILNLYAKNVVKEINQ